MMRLPVLYAVGAEVMPRRLCDAWPVGSRLRRAGAEGYCALTENMP